MPHQSAAVSYTHLVATSGPGATNLITGIATAYQDSIPIIAITGQVRSDLLGRDVFQMCIRDRAKRSGVQYVAQPGGSIRDDNVIDTCNKYGMTMSFTGIRLFHH